MIDKKIICPHCTADSRRLEEVLWKNTPVALVCNNCSKTFNLDGTVMVKKKG